jgi:hypothetical protein
MTNGTTARFGGSGFIGGPSARGKRLALEVDQFLVQLMAFALQRGKLRLRLGKLDTHLRQLRQYVCEGSPQVRVFARQLGKLAGCAGISGWLRMHATIIAQKCDYVRLAGLRQHGRAPWPAAHKTKELPADIAIDSRYTSGKRVRSQSLDDQFHAVGQVQVFVEQTVR